MDVLEAQYYLTTPLFTGGAYKQELEKPRPPSFKGVLRYWYRALAWPRLGNLEDIKKEEGDLFGTTKKQARFKLTLITRDCKELTKTASWTKQGCTYFGYGLINYKGELQRKALEPGMMLTARLILLPDITPNQIEHLIAALKTMGLFGGLGSRSRRGFGSLSLENIVLNGETQWFSPTNEKDLVNEIKEFFKEFGELSPMLPPYTALSKRSSVWISGGFSQPSYLLNELGKSMIRYRSYGNKRGNKHMRNKHMLFGREEAEQIFKEDHDTLIDFYNNKTISRHPQRVVFGLPHNYYFGGLRISAGVEGSNEHRQRRASPLFIHIHKIGNSYAALLGLLPAEFLPEGDNIKICLKKRGRNNEKLLEQGVDYGILENFIEHASKKSGLDLKRIL